MNGGPRAYLSGAIEHSPDGGVGWRRRLARLLEEELGHSVYDPAADERKSLTDEELAGFRAWKLSDPARYRGVIRKIIDWDLERIERETDYVIALWDAGAARGGGTAAEITLAHRLGKPVFLVLGMPLADASGWIVGAADAVFTTFEDLERELKDRFGRGERRADARKLTADS